MKPENSSQTYKHSAEFSNRRRALFPTDENSADPILDCISPLNIDSNRDLISFDKSYSFSLNASIGDYDIIGLVDKTVPDNEIITPQNTRNHEIQIERNPLQPLTIDNIQTPNTSTTGLKSPTQKLKTPHDIPNNSQLPRLNRKMPIDNSADFHSDLDENTAVKVSKVRTALFPEVDMSLSPKTFYSNPETGIPHRPFIRREISPQKSRRRKQGSYLCNRKHRRFGQINAGVRHNIKKCRKKAPLNNSAALQAAINIIENSPLNECLNQVNVVNSPLQQIRQSEQIADNFDPAVPEPDPEPDPSRKFFKSTRHKGVITVHNNLKLQVNNGKIAMMENKSSLKRSRASSGGCAKRLKLNQENEFDEKTESLIPTQEISEILNLLEQDKKSQSEDGALLMSPTSQMCNMASGLALNSPKKVRNLSAVLENMNSPSESKKLFPIFYSGKSGLPQKRETTPSPTVAKKFRQISENQMLLDAGQKRFGVTQCTECSLIYHMGDPSDEIMHLNYHNARHIFRFYGWKNERIIANLSMDGSRVIQVVPSDPKIWWKKVKDVIEVVNRDLGFFDIVYNTENSQVFLYIVKKIIVGVLVAEVRHSAHRLLTTHQEQVDLCSVELHPIKCGVSRIWVSQNYRKKGIATALMNCLKKNFMYGSILQNSDIAFSSPTELGKIFGTRYFQTPNFLVYLV